MQPRYFTLTASSLPTAWQVPNWHATPQELSFQVIANSTSAYSISVTLEDPTGTYPNPNSSAPTAFSIFTGASNAIFSLGSSVTAPLLKPIAGYQFSMTSLSSAGAKVTFVTLQSGIG
jgi:hypothetical protein